MMRFAIHFSLADASGWYRADTNPKRQRGGEEALVAIVGGGADENKGFVQTASKFFASLWVACFRGPSSARHLCRSFKAAKAWHAAAHKHHGLHVGTLGDYISPWEADTFLDPE